MPEFNWAAQGRERRESPLEEYLAKEHRHREESAELLERMTQAIGDRIAERFGAAIPDEWSRELAEAALTVVGPLQPKE